MEDINIRGIIAIQSHGGSGSLLLQSLLDDHPDIINLPALCTRELINFWFETHSRMPLQDIDAFVRQFINSSYHAYWFNPDPTQYPVVLHHELNTLGENKNESFAIDKNTFVTNLHWELSNREFNLINYIEAVYLAYAKTTKYKYAKNCWILFPFHVNPPEYAKLLSEGFKKVKFIYTVREPIQSLASGIRFEGKTQRGRQNHEWVSWLHNPNPCTIPLTEAENVDNRAVRFEDMHEKCEQTMRAIANWLDIEWNSCLLESTFAGKKWWSRPGLTASMNGVNPSSAKFNGHDVIPWFDRMRLEFLCTTWKKEWNYKIPFYVNNPFFEIIARIGMIFPFKIDFLPLKIPSNTRKMSYIKLLFTDVVQINANPKFKLSIVINNFLQSIKAVIKNYSVNYDMRKRILRQRKNTYNLVKLLPIE